jgi:hypothetical protein
MPVTSLQSYTLVSSHFPGFRTRFDGQRQHHAHHGRQSHPGHGPNLRLTYKAHGKSVTESLADQAAVRKAEREIAEFRKLQELHKQFVSINAQICRLRPVEETLTPEEKKRPKRSAAKSRAR